MSHKEVAVEFLKWVNEPIARKDGGLSWHSRCIAQAPYNDSYIIIDENGNRAKVSHKGIFHTEGELFEIFLKEKGIELTV